MEKIDKIKLNTVNYDETLGNSRLEFKLSSKSIDYVFINTLRRTIFNDIPIYAFTKFKFEKNTSVFNNNYIKLRLNNIPVWFIENKSMFFNKMENIIEKTEDEGEDENEDEHVDEKHVNMDANILKQLTMYVNFRNTTQDIVSVSTDDAKFYYGEKQIKSPYSKVQLIKLQPGQEIAFSAITELGIEEMNAIYSPVSVCYYNELSPTEFLFILESRGQLTEHRIVQVAIENIIKRMENMLKLLEANDENKTLEGIININNEDHTLGNLISRGMQQHENISFAGYNVTHPLARKVEIHYRLKKEQNINVIIKDVIKYYTSLYNCIKL